MQLIKLNEATAARRRVTFLLLDYSTGDPIEGANFTYLEKSIWLNGVGITPSGSPTELSQGRYYWELSTSEVNAVGVLTFWFRYNDTVTPELSKPFWIEAQIIAEDPYDSKQDEIDAIKTQTDKLLFDGSNFIKADIEADGGSIVPTVEEIVDGVWDEEMVTHTGSSSAGLYLQNSNILVESINPDAIVLDAAPPADLELGVRAFDLTGIKGIGSGDVIVAGTIVIVRLRAGIGDILYAGVPDVTESGQGVVIYKNIASSNFAVGDVIYVESSGITIGVGGFGYQPPVIKSQIRVQSRDDIIQDRITRMLGLTHENIYVENTWVGEKHTASRIELYDSKANAEAHDGSTGLIALYNLTVTYSGTKPVSQVMSKDELT